MASREGEAEAMSIPWQLTVEIAALSDPISGTVHADGERHRPFSGWMELLSEMEAALSALRTRSGCAHTGIPFGKEQK
jgi:hypothetical protein